MSLLILGNFGLILEVFFILEVLVLEVFDLEVLVIVFILEVLVLEVFDLEVLVIVFILEVFVLEVLDLEVLVIVHTREDVGNDLGILGRSALTSVPRRTPTMSLTPSLVVIPITINIILAFMLPIGRSMGFILITLIVAASLVTFVIFLVVQTLIPPAGGLVHITATAT